MNLGEALTITAPLFNIALILIALFLLIKLFKTPIRDRKIYLKPWKYIFFVTAVLFLSELTTFLRTIIPATIDYLPLTLNGFFELIMIVTILYTILIQYEHNKKQK